MPGIFKVGSVVIAAVVGLALLVNLRGNGGGSHAAVFDKGTFEESVAAAAGAKRPLLIKFTATWCPPCQMMDHEVFSDEPTAEALQRIGLVAAVDIDARRDLAKEYNIRAVPTLVIISGDDELARTEGAMDSQSLINWFSRVGQRRSASGH